MYEIEEKMMKLIIGGYAQGKLDYVLRKYNLQMNQVWKGELPNEVQDEIIVIDQFHYWVKTELSKGQNPEEKILQFVEKYLDAIIISDEIGNGIVPIDAFEREYREQTGRILIKLAERADEVERVICGIGQKLK